MTENEVQVAPDYDALARNALPLYGMAADSGVTLINHSENLTYRVDEPSGVTGLDRVAGGVGSGAGDAGWIRARDVYACGAVPFTLCVNLGSQRQIGTDT